MALFVLRRILHALVVVWAAYTAAFVLLWVVPSDAVVLRVLGAGGASLGPDADARLAQARADFGLDRPVLVQYIDALTSALTGDFGVSIMNRESVVSLMGDALPSSLALALAAAVLGGVGGVALGLLIDISGRAGPVLAALTALLTSIPGFWIALILLQVFAFKLKLVPATGSVGAATLILPSIVLALPMAAVLAQLLSTSLKHTMAEPFVKASRARGARPVRALFRQGLRSSSFPVVTSLGIQIGSVLGGTAVVETVFSRDGIGSKLVRAVKDQDVPVVLFCVAFCALVYALVNLVVDLTYPLLDPRVVPEATAKAISEKAATEELPA